MSDRRSSPKGFQVLVCLVFALTFVLSTLSSAHSHNDMHSALVAESGISDAIAENHADNASSGHCPTSVQIVMDDAGSGQCCSGICMIIALASDLNTAYVYDRQTHEPNISRRSASVDMDGFLRPPKHLI